MNPEEAAAKFLSLTGSEAIAFALYYEGVLCQSEADFDEYLEIVESRS